MPILETTSLRWADEADCAATAQRLADRPEVRLAAIELRGPLGAGKTTFVRHLLRRLGVEGRVKSPSYAVVEPYEIGREGDAGAAWHFDFYRFDDPREWVDAGLRDLYAERGLKLAEWPEKAEALLPPPDLRIAIEPLDTAARDVRFDALTPLGQALLPR